MITDCANTDTVSVAPAWREPQPPPCGAQVGASASCRVRRVDNWSGRDLFHVLYHLEPVPDAPCCVGGWYHCVPQWQPGPERGSGTAPGWAEMILICCHLPSLMEIISDDRMAVLESTYALLYYFPNFFSRSVDSVRENDCRGLRFPYRKKKILSLGIFTKNVNHA